MSVKKKHISHIKSNVLNRRPDKEKLLFGEFAINYNSQNIDVFIKDNDGYVVSIINDSNFAKYFNTVYKGNNTSLLSKDYRLNVITMDNSSSSEYNLQIAEGKIIGNEINAIFVNNTTNDITINIPNETDGLNGCAVKSFDGFEIIVPNNTNDVNMVEVNLVFDGDTYYVRIA